MSALLESNLPGLPPPRRGKVRDRYDLGDAYLIVSTDRISAFDVVMANGVPDKGRVLNQLSAFWFERLADVCPHHLITVDDDAIADRLGARHPELRGRCALVHRAEPLNIECVARGHLCGSLYKEYRDHGPGVHGLDLPVGLRDGDRLPEPTFTPATKAVTGHDENISFDEAVERVGYEAAAMVRDWTLTLFDRAAQHAAAVGLILADTKFEFGLSAEHGLIWIDEALTPDSSRFWEAATWAPGGPQPSFDKQFVRDYLESIEWDKRPPGPELPADVIAGTRERYLAAYRRLTGRDL